MVPDLLTMRSAAAPNNNQTAYQAVFGVIPNLLTMRNDSSMRHVRLDVHIAQRKPRTMHSYLE